MNNSLMRPYHFYRFVFTRNSPETVESLYDLEKSSNSSMTTFARYMYNTVPQIGEADKIVAFNNQSIYIKIRKQ